MQANLRMLAGLSHALTDLEAPSRAVALAKDTALLQWYHQSITHTLLACDGPAAAGCHPHVLVLGAGGGAVLALLAASAGARRVTVIEHTPLALRVAKQLVEANAAMLEAAGCHIQLVQAPLERCGLRAAAHDELHADADCSVDWGVGAGGGHALVANVGPEDHHQLLQQQGRREQQLFWVADPPADIIITDLAADHRQVFVVRKCMDGCLGACLV